MSETVETLGRARRCAEAYHLAYAELREAVVDAASTGNTEVAIAQVTGLSRSTVRRWTGKK